MPFNILQSQSVHEAFDHHTMDFRKSGEQVSIVSSLSSRAADHLLRISLSIRNPNVNLPESNSGAIAFLLHLIVDPEKSIDEMESQTISSLRASKSNMSKFTNHRFIGWQQPEAGDWNNDNGDGISY
jgi:hypothetical protein